MSNAQVPLAIVPPTTMGLTAHALLSNPSLFETYTKLAKLIVTSQLSYGKVGSNEDPAKKERDIFLIMLKGLEIGMLPMQALDSIDVIAGKPAIKPQGMLAQIKSKGLLESMKIEDDGSTCTVTMKRKGETEPYVEAFGMADADKMMTKEWGKDVPLSQKSNWKAQPKTMRKWRAIAACCRTAFPDVIQGMYTPEELGADVAMSDDGDMIIVEPPPAPPSTGSIPANGKKVAPDLGQKHGPIGREKPVEPPVVPPAPEESPAPQPHEELPDGDEPAPHWSAQEAWRNYIVAAIQKQTGDTTLLWETVKTLVPGETTSYTGQEFAKLAVAAWQAKQKPAQTRTGQASKEVIFDSVRYLQDEKGARYLEFVKANLFVRRYSLEKFILEVGEAYAEQNGLTKMVVMTRGDKPLDVEPIQVFYEDRGSYNIATKCIPVTDDKALDQYFGEIPFLPEAG